MSDLISRKAVLDALDLLDEDWRNVMAYKVEKIPSAERKGEWIHHDEVKNIYGGIYIECSECGEKYVVQHVEDEKFCRNCGARMLRGEEDE